MRRSRWAIGLSGIALGALSACSSEVTTIDIAITTGLETDAMTRAPAVVRVDVNAKSIEGDVDVTASAAPGEAFDLGELPAARLYTFEVTGVDAAGTTVVRGRSLGVELDAVTAGATLPVFAQRIDGWARPGGGLAVAHVDAPAAALAEQYLFTSGGTEAAGAEGAGEPAACDFYDLLGLVPAISEPSPVVARSLVTRGTAALLVGDAGASWIDFDGATVDDAALPEGLASFGDVAGGRTIEAADGVSFVIGATRKDTPTRAVLEIAADGSVTARTLARARAGAAAAWVDGIGLVVVAGSDEEPGVEVLAPGGTTFNGAPFPADPTAGAGAVVIGEGVIALIGGTLGADPAPARTLSPGCLTACGPTPVALPAIDLAGGVVAYALADGRAIAVGTEAAGAALVRAFLVDLAALSVIELPLREPRRGATPVPAPNGTLAMVGGAHEDGSPALEIELLFPP